jgi:hypothetical protein
LRDVLFDEPIGLLYSTLFLFREFGNVKGHDAAATARPRKPDSERDDEPDAKT